jgi:hypothetical protein
MKLRLSVVLLLLVCPSVFAQPFGSWLSNPAGHGYLSIPHSPDFNFTNGFTFEAWVSGRDPGGCKSIVGKDYFQAFWIGVCGTTLRSYLRGSASLIDGGTVPADVWTHIAVTWDGTTRRHFINGEEVLSRPESGPMTASTAEIRVGSDVSWEFTPTTFLIDEVRFWNVGRSKAQIRSTINNMPAAQAGLVAVYRLNNNATDAVGNHHGLLGGTATYATGAITGTCTATATSLCLANRFSVSTRWVVPDGGTGVGSVVPGASASSGLFWFFTSDNWELMVKALNGCVINSRKWVFAAGPTNVHYQIIVTDAASGQSRRYFNYQTESATLTDTDAFATCP